MRGVIELRQLIRQLNLQPCISFRDAAAKNSGVGR